MTVLEHNSPGDRRRYWRWLPPLGWAAILFALSAIPGTSYPSVAFPFADKIVHVAIYAPLGALFARAVATASPRSALVIGAALATLYGVTDEVHQMFVPFRSPDVRDVIADAIGGLLGASVLVLILRRRIARAASALKARNVAVTLDDGSEGPR